MHLYIHVPFCARRCSYCDFSIAVRRVVPDREFVASVTAEWRARDSGHAAGPVRTVYFGGGTPSRIAPEAVARILDAVAADRAIAPDAEITLEVNPDDVTAGAARGWYAAGVNRISLGVQSHDPSVLAWMHRTHRAEQVAPAVDILRTARFANISLDLIFALPSTLERDWERDLALTLALEPDHLSLYGLTIEPRTPLERWMARGTVAPADDDRYAREYLAAHRSLVEHGFEHYEVSNAARPGRRSRHNSMYWTGTDYLGLGPSAHSLCGAVRSWNIRAWEAYRAAIAAGLPAGEGSETLDPAARALEQRYFGLRTTTGVPVADIPEKTRQRWESARWATARDGMMVLTPEGWLRLDALVATLGHS